MTIALLTITGENMNSLAYKRSYYDEDYDSLEDMLADGIDIDSIPDSYYTTGDRKKTVSKLPYRIPYTDTDDTGKIPF
jgi:hypothetical protein